jgi:DNA-binding response OmpR family regulator
MRSNDAHPNRHDTPRAAQPDHAEQHLAHRPPPPLPSIFIIEHDPDLAQDLQHDLTHAGYHTIQANSLRQALTRARQYFPDLVLLDMPLPDGTTRDVILRLKRVTDARILVLTANDTTSEHATLLKLGANDTLLKPYHLAELLEFIAAHVRVLPSVVRDFHLFPATKQATCRGTDLHLSPLEFDILELLKHHPGKAYTRTMIFDAVWNAEFPRTSNIVDAHFSRLRRKLEAAGVYVLHTVWGVGYAFHDGPASTLEAWL